MLICQVCGEILPEEQAIIALAGDEGPDEEQAICPDCWEESRRWRLRAAAGAGYWVLGL